MKTKSLACILIFLIVFASCQKDNPVQEPSQPANQAHASALKIGLSMKNAPQEVVKISGLLSRSGYDTLKNDFVIANDSATCNFNNLVAGTWHLRANAFDANNLLRYSGETDVQVSAGVVTPVSIELDPVTGSIHVVVNWGSGGSASNKSLRFDGFTGYVDMPATPSLTKIDSAITLEAWVKPQLDLPKSRYYNYIICNGATEAGYTMELLGPPLNPAFTLNGLTIDYTGASDYWSRLVINQSVRDSAWTHLAVTFKYNQGINVYVNGNLAHHANATGVLLYSKVNLRLGVYLNETYQLYFRGLIDEVRIWNVARSANDINNNMKKELTGTEAGLVGYWNCNDSNSSLILADKTTNGNSGTLRGGVSFSSDTPF